MITIKWRKGVWRLRWRKKQPIEWVSPTRLYHERKYETHALNWGMGAPRAHELALTSALRRMKDDIVEAP
jgi:hypothetical protein